MNPVVSDTIKLLRFPLAFLVVVWHCTASMHPALSSECLESIDGFVNGRLVRIAVPAFFVISGYLFFINVGNFDKTVYIDKLKKRTRSLLVPYLIFSTAIIVMYFIVYKFLIPPPEKSVLNFSVSDFALSYINSAPVYDDGINSWKAILTGQGAPLAFHLWFLRDLMVMAIINPIIYWIIRYAFLNSASKAFQGKRFLTAYGLAIISIGFVLIAYFGLGGTYLQAFIFFFAGAYAAIAKCDILIFARKSTILSLALIIIACYVVSDHAPIGTQKCLDALSFLSSILLVFSIGLIFAKKGAKLPELLGECAFFIYCFHIFIIKLTERQIAAEGRGELYQFIMYFAYPVIVTLICLSTYYILRKISLPATKLVCGGR